MLTINKVHCMDALAGLKELPDESVDMVMTSPPYWQLRDYGVQGQMGMEPSLDEYLTSLMAIFDEVYRVLAPNGTCWVNLGDRYGGDSLHYFYASQTGDDPSLLSKKLNSLPRKGMDRRRWKKCLIGIPERFALAMLDRGWDLRNKIVWQKANPLPSPVKDRFTCSWEYLFLFTKSKRYYFDLDAVRLPHKRGTPQAERDFRRMQSGRRTFGGKREEAGFPSSFCGGNPRGKNPGDVWRIATQPFKQAHFAVFPEALCEKPILTTPRWICRKCGEPRKRITRTDYEWQTNSKTRGAKQQSGQMATIPGQATAAHFTTGWTKCSCNAGFRPAIVLDPFMGAGTTAVVASKVGRDFIGFEINPEYVQMAEERLEKSESSQTRKAERNKPSRSAN